ncbi:E3 ubiquitin-protein ligase RNF186 [Rhineura floridana]|uniref:E3 ubiquitin-protein ligase RNF186 n=1 Tax=Rhineura floridana TaxID=261503 RepID=UPI002AC83429|nr:E3 ubiquitin-protein ligase RNF186 [Rhineura floridana]
MEGSRDSLDIENEAVCPDGEMDQLVTAKGNPAEMNQPESCKGPTLHMDSCPGYATDSVEEDGSCGSPAVEDPSPNAAQIEAPGTVHSASPKPAPLIAAEPCNTPATDLHQPRPSKVSIADMDCLICCNRYSACRLPKVLACQHAFCAVCLKLILRNEDHTWIISCPLCRKATVVFGGLICSLRDKEDVVGRLEGPELDAAVPCPPDSPGASDANCRPVSGNLAGVGTNRAAAKRLVLLFLLAAILIALVLPFMYTGLLKWALCFVVVLGLIMSVVLCCNPSWRCSDLSLPSWRKKESQVVSVA